MIYNLPILLCRVVSPKITPLLWPSYIHLRVRECLSEVTLKTKAQSTKPWFSTGFYRNYLKIPLGGRDRRIRVSGVASDWATRNSIVKHQGGRGKQAEKDGQRDKERMWMCFVFLKIKLWRSWRNDLTPFLFGGVGWEGTGPSPGLSLSGIALHPGKMRFWVSISKDTD